MLSPGGCPKGRPGARWVGHRVGLPARVSGVWEVLGRKEELLD